MLLTIYNLPDNTQYPDIKSLIELKCGIKEMILDNLMTLGSFKKVTVGLASEEDAAILVRKLNGLYINGTQLHVEDIRKKKAMEQPYNASGRDQPHWNQQQGQPSNQHRHNTPNNMSDYYQTNYGSYNPPQNACNTYNNQLAVQYPTPQRMYQTPNPMQEPLGFRSNGDETSWLRNLRRDKEPPKNTFAPPNKRWSPERGQNNARPQQHRWDDDRAGRNGSRRKSPPRDRQLHDRDSRPSTSHRLNKRDNFRSSDYRSPQRSNDNFAPKINRDPKPTFAKPRDFVRPQFPNNSQPKSKDRVMTEPWSKAKPVPLQTKYRIDRTNKTATKRPYEQTVQQNEPHKKPQSLTNVDDVQKTNKKKKPNYTAEEYRKLETARADTWRWQTASQIAKDMLSGKTVTDVNYNAFFKELKRTLRERLNVVCHPSMRQERLYPRYRRKYKVATDEQLINEVKEKVARTQTAPKETAKAGTVKAGTLEAGTVEAETSKAETAQSGTVKIDKPIERTTQAVVDVKMPVETKPIVHSGGATCKVPIVQPAKAPIDDTEPKYTKSELYRFKREKQQTRRMFQHQNIMLKSLEPNIKKALEMETKLLMETFLQGFTVEDVTDADEKKLVERLNTTVAEDFKIVSKVQLARRLINDREPVLRVFCSPKMLTRTRLSAFLQGHGITAIKKTTKFPMLLASCLSYEVHDRLCLSEPMAIEDRIISFKPLQIAGPPVSVTKDQIIKQRKAFIERQIDNSTDNKDTKLNSNIQQFEDFSTDIKDDDTKLNTNIQFEDYSTDINDSDIKLMNDIQKFQEKLEVPNEGFIEGISRVKSEVDLSTDTGNKLCNDNVEKEIETHNVLDVIKAEEITGNVNEMVTLTDFSVDDYKIVEDTIGNFDGSEKNIDYSDGPDVSDEIAKNMDDIGERGENRGNGVIGENTYDMGNIGKNINNSSEFFESSYEIDENIDDGSEVFENIDDSGEMGDELEHIEEGDGDLDECDEQHEADDDNCGDIDIGDVNEEDLEDY